LKKITAAIIMTIILITSTATAHAQTKTFTDVQESKHAWAMEAIDFMSKRGVVSGYSDGTFKPDNGVTKAEFVSMYARLFDKYKPNKSEDEFWNIKEFQDVPTSFWAYKYISDVIYVGSWSTYSSTEAGKKFYPNTILTRIGAVNLLPTIYDEIQEDAEAFSTIKRDMEDITAYEGGEGYENDGRFDDTVDQTNSLFPIIYTVGSFDDDYSAIIGTKIASVQKSGLMTAYLGKFSPNKTLTRAEAVTTLYRLYNQLKDNGTLSEYASE